MNLLVSVVIPCRNERKYIGRCLDSLLGNDYPSVEILVVDGMSIDGTREVLRGYEQAHPNIRVMDNPAFITARALNIGVEQAGGEFIMIAGAHSAFPENYIHTMVGYLGKLDGVGVGGSLVTRSDDSVAGNSIARVLSNRIGVGNSLFRLGINKPVAVDTIPYGVYKKEVFKKAGGYDERLIRNQDIELSRRITRKAGKLYLIPEITCDYYFKGKYNLLARSGFKNGFWNMMVIYLTRNPFSISTRHLVPLFFMLFILLFTLLAVFADPFFSFPLLIVGLGYLILLLITSYRINDRSTSFFSILWSFLLLHFSYGLGSLAGLFPLRRLMKNITGRFS